MTADLQVLVKDWHWLIEFDRLKLLAISPFGDLLLQDDTGALSLLDINLGKIEEATSDETDPALLFSDAFDDRLASSYRSAGLLLSPGQCYGYKRQCVLGGLYDVANVYIANQEEYINFMGDFHRQIKDIPDGTKVTLKVINVPSRR